MWIQDRLQSPYSVPSWSANDDHRSISAALSIHSSQELSFGLILEEFWLGLKLQANPLTTGSIPFHRDTEWLSLSWLVHCTSVPASWQAHYPVAAHLVCPFSATVKAASKTATELQHASTLTLGRFLSWSWWTSCWSWVILWWHCHRTAYSRNSVACLV